MLSNAQALAKGKGHSQCTCTGGLLTKYFCFLFTVVKSHDHAVGNYKHPQPSPQLGVTPPSQQKATLSTFNGKDDLNVLYFCHFLFWKTEMNMPMTQHHLWG